MGGRGSDHASSQGTRSGAPDDRRAMGESHDWVMCWCARRFTRFEVQAVHNAGQTPASGRAHADGYFRARS